MWTTLQEMTLCSVLTSCSASRDQVPRGCNRLSVFWTLWLRSSTKGQEEAGATADELLMFSRARRK